MLSIPSFSVSLPEEWMNVARGTYKNRLRKKMVAPTDLHASLYYLRSRRITYGLRKN
jgi:hypothetical protein